MTKALKTPISALSVGATAAGRWCGTTTSGAPTTGAYVVGDWVVDRTAKIWICTTAGSPGTWNAGAITAPNVVTSGNGTANKLTSSVNASPPSSPVAGDLWLVTDISTAAAGSNAPGQEIDAVERSSTFDVQAVGVTTTDVDGMMLVVPPQTRPYVLSVSFLATFVTGTAAIAASQGIIVSVQDFTGTPVNVILSWLTGPTQVTAVSRTENKPFAVERRLEPHTMTKYYKLRVSLANAAPANWTSVQIYAEDAPTTGSYPPMLMKAVGV